MSALETAQATAATGLRNSNWRQPALKALLAELDSPRQGFSQHAARSPTSSRRSAASSRQRSRSSEGQKDAEQAHKDIQAADKR
ncbi:hypothetical protein ACFOPS_05700 [Ralstonia solanacearum]|uniref:hypothetical protein n=1 Tax=Ralstonia solanacearum TaxID=305 RepID=UPI00360E40D6